MSDVKMKAAKDAREASPQINSPITTLWIGGPLSRLEQLCIRSWLHHGHPVNVYHYHDVPNIPAGATAHDARDILPEYRIFRYAKRSHPEYRSGKLPGGYGGFANLWRYHYLLAHGGWWLDADMLLLRSLADLDTVHRKYVFAIERRGRINNAVLKMPAGCALAQMLVRGAEAAGTDQAFASTGPVLLTQCAERLHLHWYTMPTESFYPWSWRGWRTPFRADGELPSSYGAHLWNELMRRNGWDKDADYPATSIIEQVRRMIG